MTTPEIDREREQEMFEVWIKPKGFGLVAYAAAHDAWLARAALAQPDSDLEQEARAAEEHAGFGLVPFGDVKPLNADLDDVGIHESGCACDFHGHSALLICDAFIPNPSSAGEYCATLLGPNNYCGHARACHKENK